MIHIFHHPEILCKQRGYHQALTLLPTLQIGTWKFDLVQEWFKSTFTCSAVSSQGTIPIVRLSSGGTGGALRRLEQKAVMPSSLSPTALII